MTRFAATQTPSAGVSPRGPRPGSAARFFALLAAAAMTLSLAIAVATRPAAPALPIQASEGDARCVAAARGIGERLARMTHESPDVALARRAFAMAQAHCDVGRTLVALASFAAVASALDRIEGRHPIRE